MIHLGDDLDDLDSDAPAGWLETVAAVLGGVLLTLVMVYAVAGWITEPTWSERRAPVVVTEAP